MEPVRKAFGTQSTLADNRQVRVICSTNEIDRAGDIVVTAGIDTTHFVKLGGTVLFNHNVDAPIARAVSIGLNASGDLESMVQFPPEGDDPSADLTYNRIKNGVLNGVSIGFNPIKSTPLDPAKPRGPQRYEVSELCEFSFVSVPANRGSKVIERQLETPAQAEATPPKKATPVVSKMLNKMGGGSVVKGLWHVAVLANLLDDLGWLEDMAEYEAQIEGDDSPVPAMLRAVMQALGAALVAMTDEEVRELLAGEDDESDALILDDDIFMASAPDRTKAFVAGICKAGKVLSQTNHDKLKQAHGMIGDVLDAATPPTDDNDGDEKAAVTAKLKRTRIAQVLALAA